MPDYGSTLELLSPANTAAIGREAVTHGADAVYIGGPSFGAREVRAQNAAQPLAYHFVSYRRRT